MASAKKTPKSTGVLLLHSTDNTALFYSLTRQRKLCSHLKFAIKNQDQILIPFVGWEVCLYKNNKSTIHQGTEGQIPVLPVDIIRVWQQVIKTKPAVPISMHKHDIERFPGKCNKNASRDTALPYFFNMIKILGLGSGFAKTHHSLVHKGIISLQWALHHSTNTISHVALYSASNAKTSHITAMY